MNKFGAFLIFLSIIILCGVAFFVINPLKILADRNDKIRIRDLQTISQALEKYHRAYGRYPSNSARDYMILTPDGIIPWGVSWEPYLALVPKDPSSARRYVYVSSSTDNYQSYRLYASLQGPAVEEQACSVTGQCPNVPGESLCGAHCNYGVTSSNTSP